RRAPPAHGRGRGGHARPPAGRDHRRRRPGVDRALAQRRARRAGGPRGRRADPARGRPGSRVRCGRAAAGARRARRHAGDRRAAGRRVRPGGRPPPVHGRHARCDRHRERALLRDGPPRQGAVGDGVRRVERGHRRRGRAGLDPPSQPLARGDARQRDSLGNRSRSRYGLAGGVAGAGRTARCGPAGRPGSAARAAFGTGGPDVTGERGHLRVIHEQAERAGRIVRNLLTFARKGPAEQGRVNLNDVIQRTLLLMAHDLKLKDITVEKVLPTIPEILGDRHALQQAVLNLLNNAAQAVAENTPGRRRLICVNTWFDQRVRMRVSDSGPGIPDAVVPQLFTPFFTTKEPGQGTGLGLSITYSIVEAHGGRINLERPPDGGAAFLVDLPPPPPPPPPPLPPPPPAAPPP